MFCTRVSTLRPLADVAITCSCRSWNTSAANSARSPSWRRIPTSPATATPSSSALGSSSSAPFFPAAPAAAPPPSPP
uniref:Uncharacterized protein n=1 Tax=Arundo donax TaxID=35708 RepID=A0A0A9EVT7_ARUDO